MAVSGTRFEKDGSVVPYANTTKFFHKLEELGENYFRKYGFGEVVTNLRKVLAENGIGKDLLKASNLFQPWFTLSTTSVNYGNECHIDPNDAAPGITIWHERVVPPEVMEDNIKNWDPSANIKNWYFIFPDLEILVDGKWRQGVAIPLQHGTVVTRDGNLIRHCTAVPTLEPPHPFPKRKRHENRIYKTPQPEPGSDKSSAWGTYFGIQKTVVKACLSMISAN